MVKCDNCGITIPEGMESCPNCGKPAPIKAGEDQEFKSDESQEDKTKENQELKSEEEQNSSEQTITRTCKNCGARIYSDNIICPLCGNRLDEEYEEKEEQKCEKCGTPIPENTLFCPTCGTKVNNQKGTGYSQEYSANINDNIKKREESNSGIGKKINLVSIIIPAVIALIMSIVLSIIGLWLELSWYAYIIAIIISVGFCAAPIDNEINATISGFIVGLFLGILESPLVGFVYGSFAAELYEYYVGTHLITLIILGVVVAFLSNMFLKKPVTNIVTKIKKMM
ncbi:zinc ribbon domain-containing protein [uncultured Methanosphaera sp.]|jgi:RNA polymerase subunit RPABC4/transcription elongation factor Spt4|uniref:zinc ribbon domain-containing protein n=1 Tax=uncultured Methanosphaera sp. TaxID=262501 RepID=UPI000DC60C60|nr:zinc ribbon domain-containing protein [uncultured Methanosphaera sp.]RAP43429.1 MAG: hypothetical protein BZ134_06965 [Methanosphaera sp. SHI1033]